MQPLNQREVRAGEAATFRFRPPVRWASATGFVKSPDGSTQQTGSPTVDSTSTTVNGSTSTESVLVLTAVTGISRGVVYQVTDPQWGTAQSEVSAVDATAKTVTLVEPLPNSPANGATFLGVEVTMAITAITDRALGYRAIVRGASDGQEEVSRFDVVYQPFRDPISARDVRSHIGAMYPNHPWSQDEERMADVAHDASTMVRLRLREADRYPDRYIDSDDLIEAGQAAMELILAKAGMMPGNVDPADHKRGLRFDLRDAVALVVGSNLPYDDNDDGKIDQDTEVNFLDGRLYR